jgi:hypothetical protein
LIRSMTKNLTRQIDADENSSCPLDAIADDKPRSENSYTQEEKDAAIQVFLMLIEQRDIARKNGLIDW